jgi:hypothetical protein
LAGIGAVAMAFNECERVLDALLIVGLEIPPDLFDEVLPRLGSLDGKVDIIKKAAVRVLRFDVASWGAVVAALDEFLKYKRYRDAIVHATLEDRKSGIGIVFKRDKAYEVLLTAEALNALYERLWSLKEDLDTISVTFDFRGYYLHLDRAREMIEKRDASVTPDIHKFLVKEQNRRLALVQANHKKRQSLPPLPDFPDDG